MNALTKINLDRQYAAIRRDADRLSRLQDKLRRAAERRAAWEQIDAQAAAHAAWMAAARSVVA